VSGQIKAIPDIPTTVMAQSEASLAVIPRGAPLPDVKPLFSQAVRERWNDYGIGLLLQGDLKAAEAAFLHVTEMDPGYADGPVNVARAQIQEGNVAAAEPMLQKALAIDPKLAKAHYFLGTCTRPRAVRRGAGRIAGGRRAISARSRRARPDRTRACFSSGSSPTR
jgi:Tfp pilus assembly protein PilF